MRRYTMSFPSHRFPLTFPHRDTSCDIIIIIIPNQILYYYFLFRRGHVVDIAIHTRAPIYNHTRVSTMGQWDDFPRTPYCRMYMSVYIVDDDPFPLRSTLFRTLAGHPFYAYFFPGQLAIV